jgi:hypothetical protein
MWEAILRLANEAASFGGFIDPIEPTRSDIGVGSLPKID